MFKSEKWQVVFSCIITFLAYTSVYAFRKPFSVGSYNGLVFLGLSYKSLLVISQSIGYLLSKVSGIVVISQQKKVGRWKLFLFLIIGSWISLYIFALLPPPFGIFCFLVNGYMLGFCWGIVFSYIEGKRSTDLIGAVMSVSFIFAGGFTRSVGLYLKNNLSIPENWIAFDVGLIFIFPLLFLMFLLEKIPKPNKDDILSRLERPPMTRKERSKILKDFGIGLFLMIFIYVLLTILRDIRDNYMSNIWEELGFANRSGLLTQTETITTLVILGCMALIVLIKDNLAALKIIHYLILIGFFIAACSSVLFLMGIINGIIWMQLTGLGIYLAYIPFNCVYYERFISAFHIIGNVGFLMYLSDSYGYFGSLATLLFKEWIHLDISWAKFYMYMVLIFTAVGITGTLISWKYFNKKYKNLSFNET